MKAYLRHTAFLLLLLLLLLLAADVVYTEVYKRTPAATKMQYALKTPNITTDYLFLGSSRVVNHIVPEEIEAISGKSVLNFGVPGSLPADNLLLLELMLQNGLRCETIFMQVDHVFNEHGASELFLGEAMPFVRQPLVETYFRQHAADFKALYYVPFYRYMKSEYAIGVRGLVQQVRARPEQVLQLGGFMAREGAVSFRKSELPGHIDCRHLHEEGARVFSRDLIREYLGRKQ